jgi:DNA-binding transcriptional ArsR family regulator
MGLNEMDEMSLPTEGLPEEKVSEKRPDLPPEYCHYRDEGCALSNSCLNCPFPNCVYEEPGGRQRWLKRMRAREMARLFTTGGKSVKELALIFGVSQRTVQRALKVALGPDLSGKRGQQNE